MFRHNRAFVATVSFALGLILALPHARSELREELDRAWAERESAVQAISCTWKDQVTVERGGWTTYQETDDGIVEGPTVPEQQIHYVTKSLLRVDKKRFRNEVWGDRFWSPTLGRAAERHMVRVYDGAKQITLFDEEPKRSAMVFHDKQDNSGQEGAVDLKPITLAFWPRSQRFQTLSWKSLVVSPEPVLLDGKECILAETTSTGGFTVRQRIWIDHNNDFVIRRFQSHRLSGDNEEQLLFQVDLDYAPHDSFDWVPKTWDLVVTSEAGKSRMRHHAEMLELDINPVFEADDFAVSFPEGTSVRESIR